jgi:branched-chain amino acid transport system permease protein
VLISQTFLVSTGLTHCRREPNFGDNKPQRADGILTRRERGASPQHAAPRRSTRRTQGRILQVLGLAAYHVARARRIEPILHRRRKDRAVMTLALLVEQLFNGVQFGLMLFLMAVGVTLVFGIMRVINLAHGSLFMLGGYFLMAALAWTRSYGWAIPLAFLGAALVAVVLEIVVLRPLYRRGPLDQVLATFGLTLFFNEAVTVIWGRESIPLSIPPFLTGSVEIIPGSAYPIYRLVITAVAIVAGLLLYLLITRTRVGALIRAGSDNREIVAALGININLLYTLIFALSAMLAALAGIMMGPLLSVEPGAGDPILILALVVVVIGGIGSVRGALVGALMVGIFDTLSRVLIPLVIQTNATSALVGMAVYVLMAVVLLFSRTGLFAAHRG